MEKATICPISYFLNFPYFKEKRLPTHKHFDKSPTQAHSPKSLPSGITTV